MSFRGGKNVTFLFKHGHIFTHIFPEQQKVQHVKRCNNFATFCGIYQKTYLNLSERALHCCCEVTTGAFFFFRLEQEREREHVTKDPFACDEVTY